MLVDAPMKIRHCLERPRRLDAGHFQVSAIHTQNKHFHRRRRFTCLVDTTPEPVALMLEWILFLALAGGAITSTILVVAPPTGRNPLYAALMLVVSFFFMAGLYVMLLAHLMAVLQVLVYAGAIMVLFMFVIMLLNLSDEELGKDRWTIGKSVGAVALGFIVTKVGLILSMSADKFNKGAIDPTFGTVDSVGDLLFRQFLFPFEMTSILLLIAVIGAVVLAKRTL